MAIVAMNNMKNSIRTFTILTLLSLAGKSFAQTCKADAGRDTTICSTGTVTIGGAAPGVDTSYNCNEVLYRWEPSTGLSDAHAANPVASPSQTTTYTLTVYFRNTTTSDTCCFASDAVTITVGGNCSVMPMREESWVDEMETLLAVRDKDRFKSQQRWSEGSF